MRCTRLTLAYLVLACTLLLVSAPVLSRKAASSPATSKQSADATSAELAKESREAAGEDEQAQFKHSCVGPVGGEANWSEPGPRLLVVRVAEFCGDRRRDLSDFARKNLARHVP